MISPFTKEALRTFTANRWTLLCARLFGQKTVSYDGRYQVTLHHWRGKTYLTDFKEQS